MGAVRRVLVVDDDDSIREVAEVARACRTSPRSLQRQLAEHGTTFAAVLQSAREELARVWVEAGDRPLGDIAYSLGSRDLEWNPLVLLNACQGGQMTTLFYKTLAATLLERKAVGLVGPQIDMPAVFAAEFRARIAGGQ